MRQLLDLIKFGRRDPNDPSKAEDAPASRPDPAKTLIIAGEAVPCADETHSSDSVASAKSDETSDSQSLADVVKARQKDRWQAPELDGPEFGGLIERRGVDARGLMPTKFKETQIEEHRKHQETDGAQATAKPSDTPDGNSEASLESTGMFLASLENSAITLADSGMFKVTDEPEADAEPTGKFNPYNRRSD